MYESSYIQSNSFLLFVLLDVVKSASNLSLLISKSTEVIASVSSRTIGSESISCGCFIGCTEKSLDFYLFASESKTFSPKIESGQHERGSSEIC